MRLSLRMTKTLMLCGAASIATTAAAQETATPSQGVTLNEIIVTAQKRQENLLDVPVAVTAFTARDLDARGAVRFTDIAYAVPNLVYEQAADVRNQRIVLRGISGDVRFPGAESAVGVVVDGVSLAGVAGLAFDLPDIQQIEVLRGPQGTLYGRNTTAGVINITTRTPGQVFTGSLTAEVGNLDHRLLKGWVGGPLIEGLLSGGVSFIHAERGGFERAVQTGQDLNSRNTDSVRAQVVLTPGGDWRFRVIGEYTHDDYHTQAAQTVASGRDVVDVAFAGMTDRKLYGVSGTAEKTFASGITFKSITSYRRYTTSERNDGDGFPLVGRTLLDRRNSEESREFTEEIQLSSGGDGRLDWIVGGFFLDQSLDFNGRYDTDLDGFWSLLVQPSFPGNPSLRTAVGLFGGAGNCPAPAPACTGVVPARVSWSFDTRSSAIFGQVGYDVTERLKLTVGARYSHETKDFTYNSLVEAAWPFPVGVPLRTVFIAGPTTPGFLALPIKDDLSQDVFTPKVSLVYKLGERNNLYASISKGYKSGSFFANVLGVSDANNNGQNDYTEFLKVDKETSWNYEAGLKGYLTPAARYALTAFYIDYKGLQTQRQLFVPSTGGSFNFLGNADAEVYGAEAEIDVQINESLRATASAGYSHARYTDYQACSLVPPNPALGTPASVLDCDGNRLVYAPTWTGAAGLDYQRPIGSGLVLTAGVDGAYRGRQYFDATNFLAEKGYVLWNARIGVGAEDGRWSVTAWGRNLSDKQFATSITPGQGGSIFRTFGAPRTYGLRLNLTY